MQSLLSTRLHTSTQYSDVRRILSMCLLWLATNNHRNRQVIKVDFRLTYLMYIKEGIKLTQSKQLAQYLYSHTYIFLSLKSSYTY